MSLILRPRRIQGKRPRIIGNKPPVIKMFYVG